MKETRPTEKALLAIADICPIISLSWIERMRENKDSTNFHFPPVEEHQPPLNAVCDNVPERPNFLPMPRRKTVFTDATFYVFSEEQVSKLSLCVGILNATYHCQSSTIVYILWFRNVEEILYIVNLIPHLGTHKNLFSN